MLCFDEFDALVPSRKESTHASMAGEVNEFLSQLNNCGKKGVFVIATSNRPDMIDPAVLRTGRIDRMIYVPVPDKDARRVLFEINLKGRPTEDVDCAALAERTVNFVASDIAYAVQRRGHHGGIRQCAHFSEDSLRNARLYAAVGHGGDAGRVRQAARQDDRHGAAGRTYSDRI